MVKDERLNNNHDLEKELRGAKYQLLFTQNPFSQNETLIAWLGDQLNERITGSKNEHQTRFEDVNFPSEIPVALNEGDYFYTQLFDGGDWIPEQVEDKRSETPFSDAIERLYNSLWNIQNEKSRSELIIYSELEHYIEAELGSYVAKQSASNNINGWESIQDATHGLWEFYKSWIANIDGTIIQSFEHDLSDSKRGIPLHEFASFMERRHKKETVSSNYAAELEKLKDESHWVYVRESTSGSDYITLHSQQALREELLLKLGLKSWLKWVDGLQWPMIQDHAFFFIQRVDWLEKLIGYVVNEEVPLKTSRQYLLLIALKNYGELIIKISDNLFQLKEGEWSYLKNEEEKKIIDTAQQRYEDWMRHELKNSCSWVFHTVFDSLPISESKYFDGVFEWINSLSKEHYSNKRPPKPSLNTLNILNNEFQQKLNLDTANKVNIATRLPMKKMNWEVFEKLVGILEYDESDTSFRQVLYDKYLSYLESGNFRWKVSFEDLFINQACNFSYVIKQLTNPLNTWTSVFANFQCLQEGWLAPIFPGHEAKSKEAFVLMAGACLSYTYYKDGDSTNGLIVFDCVLENTISQYRCDFSISEKDYQIVLQLLAHTAGKFDLARANVFAQSIVDKIDSEEAFLLILQTLIAAITGQSQHLSARIKTNIEQRVNTRFWILEERYKKGMHSKEKLKYYSELRDVVLTN